MKLRRTLLTAGLIMALSAGAAFAAEPANTNPWGLFTAMPLPKT